MNSDQGSLAHLHDVIVPAPVPWWPPALGWLIVASMLTLALGWWLERLIRLWQSNCYRREALALLDSGRISGGELAILVKRVALSVYPRESVASLVGERWLSFLDQTGQTNAFTSGAGRWIVRLPYEPELMASLPESERRRLVVAIRDWIIRHRAKRTPQ
jgi:hypothetical protein